MLKINIFVLVFLLTNLHGLLCQPVVHTSQESGEDNDGSNQEINTISNSDTRIVDLKNIDARILEQLRSNNINLTALREEQMQRRAKKVQRGGGDQAPAPLTQAPSGDGFRKEYEEDAIENIKNIIQHSLVRNFTTSMPTDVITHEIAFPAACELPRYSNETSWCEGNTLNLFFKYTPKKFSLTSAVLRLYKKSSDGDNENCTDHTENLLRVTVSVYQRRSRRNGDINAPEKRKRLCSSLTVSAKHEGWVELDIKLAVKQWEKSNRNLGLAIDVQDMDDKELRAQDYFHPIECSQASPTTILPWSFYKHTLSYTSNEMDTLPHLPRLDIMWSTDTVVQRRTFHHRQRPVRHNHRHINDHHTTTSDEQQTSLEQSSEQQISAEGTLDDEQTHVHRKRHLIHRLAASHRNSQERLRRFE